MATPYHPLVYHLDLSILAYQLYSQSLAWPFDPYYEERAETFGIGRANFMVKAHDWARRTGAAQSQAAAGLDTFRGPGVLGNFPNNPAIDPIIFNYSTIHPWSASITNADGRWVEYLTPGKITGMIRDVYMCYRAPGGAEGDVLCAAVPPGRTDCAPDAADVLLAFEGGTGDKGEPGQPASQSLMGFVLARATGADSYEVHIAFRGSRSGSGGRAVIQAFSSSSASGNPDWITDLGWDKINASSGGGHVTTIGSVSRGFARSMGSILPAVFACLRKVAELKGNAAPKSISVTGHSLGGALAQHFVSAVLLGHTYGPGAAGPAMPDALRSWPWKSVRLITFGSPRAGDEEWAKTLTKVHLQSDFFSTLLDPVDRAALKPTDPAIVSRLLDTSRPAGFRVLISTDPITTEKIGGGGKHVGKTVYVNTPLLGLPSFESHEPELIRKWMVDMMADPNVPPIAWRYRAMAELNPERDEGRRGTRAEMQKLADSVRRYYSDHRLWFDEEAFARRVAVLFSIEDGSAS